VPGSALASSPGADQPAGPGVDNGAATHYAVDVSRKGGAPFLRLAFVDTSLRSLAAGDPVQHPLEAGGGQAAWLDRVLCIDDGGEHAIGGCSRRPDQQAIVVSEAPSYSYGPGYGTETQTDSAAFESILIKNRVSMVVSGRLGWNGLYWAFAPGVHYPCAGGRYAAQAPPTPANCAEAAGVPVEPPGEVPAAAGQLSESLHGLGAPPPPTDPTGLTAGKGAGVLPFVIASGAGGKLAGSGEGFWHGYTIARLDASGDPRKTIFEQRPIFDWLLMTAQEHVLRPGQRMTLKGVGRGPLGVDEPANIVPINSASITHRYDLVLADPEKPYLPLEDANGDYVPVPAKVATVDATTGAIRTGRGNDKRTFAIGILSVGDKVATYPVAFEPRRSSAPARAKVQLPAIPRLARAPVPQPPARLAPPSPPPPAAPPATPASPFSAQTIQPPQPLQVPSLPAANAPPAPAPPQLQAPPPPPAPPAPPPIPAQPQPLPLALNAKLQPVSIVPSVNPPSPPPVNPAPPAGSAARKEAKQRQAAAAKSEEGEGGRSNEHLDVEIADAPNMPGGAAMTRRDRDRPLPSLTTLQRPAQASAWTRDALYGGGLGLAALAFTAGWLTMRPRPRRRPLAAPERARAPTSPWGR
jgi:hypothetical protein